MKLIIFSALAAAAAAQTPDVGTIMENVGRNQAQAVACVAAGRNGVNGLDRRVAALSHQLE